MEDKNREETTKEEETTPLLPPPEEPIDWQDSLPPPSPSPRKRQGLLIIPVLLLSIGVLLTLLLLPGNREQEELGESSAKESTEDTEPATDRIIFIRGEEEADGLLTPQEIYQTALPCVVSILREHDQTVAGGFLYADGSYIATTATAIMGTDSPLIRYADGTQLRAQEVASDSFSDLALLKVEKTANIVLPTGSTEELLAGDEVYSLGCSSDGLLSSFASGSVSHPQRRLTITDQNQLPQKKAIRIQTSLPASTGFCGCPLLNERGQIIGILTTDGTEAFAIPIGGAVPILDAMLRGETLSDSLLASVSIRMPTLGITGDGEKEENGSLYGVRIRAFTDPDSDAARKLMINDLITHVESTPVTTASQLEAAIAAYDVGQAVRITVYRSEQSLTFDIVLSYLS